MLARVSSRRTCIPAAQDETVTVELLTPGFFFGWRIGTIQHFARTLNYIAIGPAKGIDVAFIIMMVAMPRRVNRSCVP